MTEFNNAYFKGVTIEKSETNKLSKYIEFKIAVETHLTEQQTIHNIAHNLAITTNNLYNIVKEFSGYHQKNLSQIV